MSPVSSNKNSSYVRVEVPLKHSPYTVHIGHRLLPHLSELLHPLSLGRRCALITDSHVAPLFASSVAESLKNADYHVSVATIPAGESSKSMHHAAQLCEELVHMRLDRNSFVIALGGGVVGDLAGFVAAIYYRGIRFVQIPTTVMAQADSSVGGKTGVNATSGKNLIGAFHQPAAVIADLDTLHTLPERIFHEGLAEVIKHALIRDASLIDLLEDTENFDPARIIPRNVQIKSSIVCADEKETSGVRALLNFGHTIGHAIEQSAGYGNLLHGEAVSLGLAAACHLSERLAGFPSDATHRTLKLLEKFKLPTSLKSFSSIDPKQIEETLWLDKKFQNGKIRFVLCSHPGQAFLSEKVTLEDVREGIAFLYR